MGDAPAVDGTQATAHLVTEIAYEHWHRMLFARFLAESNLLMHPDGYPVSLADCKEDAATMDPPARSEWEVAGRYASAMLQTLVHTYLGDWITQQRRTVEAGGAQAGEATLKLAKAEALKTQLEAILEGEAPYDIFVRWKPLHQQPVGWDPDLNDGVRMNIRPFVEAGVLRLPRNKLGIKWEADRGKDVPSAPWYKLGPAYGEPEGTRINDHHLWLADKHAARAK
jgi:hypothetical protein